MEIRGIRLNNFRNYASLSLRPDEGLCVLTGENAAGKTNVLEAIFLSSLGRSHRTCRDTELIRSGEQGAYVGINVSTLAGMRRIETRIPANERKRVSIDGTPLARSGELLGCLNVVMFAPEDLSIVKDGPGERRRFLDMMLSKLRPSYYYSLQRYNAALRQRNALLKDPAADPKMLEPWDDQLALLGAGIVLARAEQIEKLAEIGATLHDALSDGTEELTIGYRPNFMSEDASRLADLLRDALYEASERDFRYGSTTVGPHRDDILLSLNGADVRTFGSQGQQRTTALSLKLSELELIQDALNDMPVLLLDDVFSELDKRRQRMLIEAVQGCQTFLTCTHLEQLEDAGAVTMQIYNVRDGQVFEV